MGGGDTRAPLQAVRPMAAAAYSRVWLEGCLRGELAGPANGGLGEHALWQRPPSPTPSRPPRDESTLGLQVAVLVLDSAQLTRAVRCARSARGLLHSVEPPPLGQSSLPASRHRKCQTGAPLGRL